jgi:hypothetical protein
MEPERETRATFTRTTTAEQPPWPWHHPVKKHLTFFVVWNIDQFIKTKWILPVLMAAVGVSLAFSAAGARDEALPAKLLADAGKTFTGPEDPAFISYDMILRDYLVKRINKQYGITLDPKVYSGFDLLEIEALLKCKKSNESADSYLSKFKKRP